jgi:hypothetical protein
VHERGTRHVRKKDSHQVRRAAGGWYKDGGEVRHRATGDTEEVRSPRRAREHRLLQLAHVLECARLRCVRRGQGGILAIPVRARRCEPMARPRCERDNGTRMI